MTELASERKFRRVWALLAALTLVVSACASSEPPSATMIDDETSVDAWILYRDLLIADTG